MGAFLMANTYNEHNGTGSQDTFAYTFPYLKTTDVKVSVDGVVKQLTTDYTRPSVTTIQFNSDKKPANGTKVRIYRDTNESSANATFYAGSAIKSQDLNDNFLQAIYIGEEGKENADDAWNKLEDSIDSTETWVSDNTKIGTTGAVDARVDSKINTELTNGSKNFNTSGTLAAGATTVTGNIAVSGTVDGRDVAADGTKLDGIESGATADQTNAEIRAAIEAASDSNVFTDADHSKLNAIEASATADQTVSEIKSLIAGSPLDASHLAPNSVGDSEIATGALDNRYYTETESDARYFKQDSSETITSGVAWSGSDSYIATTGAIDARITDLVDDVGGFVPIVNETSFPNANPDVNNGAGTLVSIKALSSNLTSNGSGVATITNGTVGNSTVTITGLANSTTYAANFGMIVETTSTLNTYTFHRQVPIATEVSAVAGSITNVNTVATNINSVNDFADKYRIASSAPGSNNDDGDLYYNTSDNKLYVYNGSAWEVAASLNGSGGTVTGDTTFTDDTKLKLGTGGDLQIWHDGSHGRIQNSTGHFYLRANSADVGIEIVPNGTVKLRYDNSNKLQTTSAGVQVVGELQATGDFHLNNNTNSGKDVKFVAASNLFRFYDDVKLTCGNGDDLQLYHDGSHSYLANSTGNLYINAPNYFHLGVSNGGEKYITATENGAVELYYDNSKKLSTDAHGVQIHDWRLQLNAAGEGEAAEMYFYADQGDDSGDCWRLSATDGSSSSGVFALQGYPTSGLETFWRAHNNGAIELYYDNAKKLETYANGAIIYGPEGGSGILGLYADEGDDNGDKWRFHASSNGNFYFQNYAAGTWETSITGEGQGKTELRYDNVKKIETTSTGGKITKHLEIAADDGGIDLTAIASNSNAYLDIDAPANRRSSLRFKSAGTIKWTIGRGDSDELSENSFFIGTGNSGGGDGNQKLTITDAGNATFAGDILVNGTVNEQRFADTTVYSATTRAVKGISVANQSHIDGSYSSIELGSENALGYFGSTILSSIATGTNYANDFVIQSRHLGNYNESLRITSEGNATFAEDVYVGTTVTALGVDTGNNTGINLIDSGRIYVKSNDHSEFAAIGGGEIIRFRYGYTDGTTQPTAGSINITGTGSVAYNTSSDYRLKENEVAISDGITRLKTLKPYRFNFKAAPSTTVDGFFAHEAQAVVPESVTGTKDEVDSNGDAVMQGIDQAKMVPLLTAALQEAIAKIETLEAKVAALESS